MLNDYNNEHWWPIITSIMLNAIKCAYLIADITNYCLLCAEIIGKNILLSDEDKSNIQKNLLGVLAVSLIKTKDSNYLVNNEFILFYFIFF